MRTLVRSGVLLFLAPFLLLTGCEPAGPEFDIAYEEYQLDNGLTVVLHEDKSDPVVAVAILYHVGSNREEVGKTGFAHLFEHMMFQSSQHVGEDQFFQKHNEELKQKLRDKQITKMSVTNALGCGQQQGYEEHYRGTVVEVNLLKKVRLEIGVTDEFVDPTVSTIVDAASAFNLLAATQDSRRRHGERRRALMARPSR